MCKYFFNRQSRDTVNPTAGESAGRDAKDKAAVRSAVELSEVTELEPVGTLRGWERMKMGETSWWWEERCWRLWQDYEVVAARRSAVVVIKMAPW